MSNESDFDTYLIIGILKSLKHQGLLTETEMRICISILESGV